MLNGLKKYEKKKYFRQLVLNFLILIEKLSYVKHTLILFPAKHRVVKFGISLMPSIVKIPLLAKFSVTKLHNFDTPYIRKS